MVSPHDRALVRNLARQVAEIAALPIMAQRREMWKRHNRLERVRPMVLVFPEGGWEELLTERACRCRDETLRGIELSLRRRIYQHEHLHDDTVIEAEWIISKAISNTGWGLQPRRRPSPTRRGAWTFDPVIQSPADLQKLCFPEVTHDERATAARLAFAQDLLGDILDVRLVGIRTIGFHLMQLYSGLRGLDQVFMDMTDNPGLLHEAMAFLEEGHRRMVQQYVELNLLSLNNDSAYNNSGGVSYTTELPKPGFDPQRVRPCDMWAMAETQEFALVSPAMHEQFALQYERRLLAPFGLTGYGCCEDLTNKLDLVFTIPNIRRISISPFANVERCAAKLGCGYIFSWKPHPSHVAGAFDPGLIRRYIRHTLEVTRDCVIEMILKDTHTCDHHPERFTIWTDISRELAEQF